jgi:hypothetical protein
LLIALAVTAGATTYVVDIGGGGDYTNIKSAMLMASPGDTILVEPGTYTGPNNVDLLPAGVNLVFLANSSPGSPVVLDCGGPNRAIEFSYGEDASTIFHGFTIQNADIESNGGGMRIADSSPRIENCTFTDCHAWNGGAVAVYRSDTTFDGCTFTGNTADYRGGGAYVYESTSDFTGCLFDDNSLTSTPQGAGALHLQSGTNTVTDCTLVENTYHQITVYGVNSSVFISNCVIADSPDGVSIGVNADGNGFATHCILYGNALGDEPACSHSENMYVDPLFCDAEADDYTLCEDSPALAANNPWIEDAGAFGAACPACGSPVEDATWGAVKALFR